jgi:hypothetical protein
LITGARVANIGGTIEIASIRVSAGIRVVEDLGESINSNVGRVHYHSVSYTCRRT